MCDDGTDDDGVQPCILILDTSNATNPEWTNGHVTTV
jgi:hypothetical protein